MHYISCKIKAVSLNGGENKNVKKTKFQQKREETYKRLIDKGYEVLVKKGFTKTNIEDISNAAGYTRGAFYFHFESKEDFFIHVLKHHDALRGNWSDLPYHFDPNNTSLEEVLKISISSLFDKVYGEAMGGWLLVYIEFYQNTKDDPSIKTQLKELHKLWEVDITKFIEGLQEQGYISSSSIHSKEAALKFIMATYGFMVNYYIFDKKDIELLIKSYVKILS